MRPRRAAEPQATLPGQGHAAAVPPHLCSARAALRARCAQRALQERTGDVPHRVARPARAAREHLPGGPPAGHRPAGQAPHHAPGRPPVLRGCHGAPVLLAPARSGGHLPPDVASRARVPVRERPPERAGAAHGAASRDPSLPPPPFHPHHAEARRGRGQVVRGRRCGRALEDGPRLRARDHGSHHHAAELLAGVPRRAPGRARG
mmetsp:Transcript_19951/g.67598  ORF Transcript_19951/g.67598 Transcript_19951/m.67598 type:complete len:205 (+) Transcript_19951:627-1241(+)